MHNPVSHEELIRSAILAKKERSRIDCWPRIGISLKKVMAYVGGMEDLAKLLRADEGYADAYTIEEQIQRASDNIRSCIRAFENIHEVKIEIFTPLSRFEDHTKAFLQILKRPEEIAEEKERNKTTQIVI